MRRQILLSSVRLPPRSGRLDTPDLVPSDFSRYLRTVSLDMYLMNQTQTMNQPVLSLDLIDDEAKMKKLANISNPIQTITQRLLSLDLIQDESSKMK
jgi:hypothetical protein